MIVARAGARRGQAGPLISGILALIVTAWSNNAFRKLNPVCRLVDAGSRAASGLLMLIAQWLL